MKKIILLFLTILAFTTAKSQCGVTFEGRFDVCYGDQSCNANFTVILEGVIPFSVTHGGNTNIYNNPNVDSHQIYYGNRCLGSSDNFVITDGNGCTLDTTIVIGELPEFIADIVVTSPNYSTSSCDGEITGFNISGGIPPFTTYVRRCIDSSFVATNSNLCAGEYFGIVQDSLFCLDTTDCISTQILSFNNKELDEFKVTLFQSQLEINQPYDNLKIYNLSGQIVLESNISEQIIPINLLVKGLYIVSVLKDGEIHSEKVIVSE